MKANRIACYWNHTPWLARIICNLSENFFDLSGGLPPSLSPSPQVRLCNNTGEPLRLISCESLQWRHSDKITPEQRTRELIYCTFWRLCIFECISTFWFFIWPLKNFILKFFFFFCRQHKIKREELNANCTVRRIRFSISNARVLTL